MSPSVSSGATAAAHQLLIQASSASQPEQGADEILRREIDWTSVIAGALHHRLIPALRCLLEASDPAFVPVDLLDALRRHDARLREHSRALTRELFDILDALNARSITGVAFKGPLLGELLFGDYGLRAPGDIDILVQPHAVSSLCEVLAARGYIDAGRGPRAQRLTPTQERIYRRYQCEYTWIRESDGAVVEPHWALSQRSLAADVNYGEMLSRARMLTLCGRSVLVLAPDDLLLALCIHGTKHEWRRLAWIRDVGGLTRMMEESALDACVERARSAGCLRLLLVGLALASRFGGARIPSSVEQLVQSDAAASRLAAAVGAKLFDVSQSMTRNDRFDRFRFDVRERWRDRIRYVTRTHLAPGRSHLEIVALPGPLQWAYFPLRWAHDFAVMPAWRLARRQLPAAGPGRHQAPLLPSGAARADVRATKETPSVSRFRVSRSHVS